MIKKVIIEFAYDDKTGDVTVTDKGNRKKIGSYNGLNPIKVRKPPLCFGKPMFKFNQWPACIELLFLRLLPH